MQAIKKTILLGVLSFIPIWLTLSLLSFLLGFISNQVDPVITELLVVTGLADVSQPFLAQAPFMKTVLASLLVLLLFYLWGLLTKRWVGRQLIGMVDAVMARIPVAKPVYRAVKGLMTSMQGDDELSKKVVFVEYPTKGVQAVAFLTKSYFDPSLEKDVAVVFIPMGPAPTAGFVHIVSKDKITETNWTVEDALSFIISGGTKIPVIAIDPATSQSDQTAETALDKPPVT